MRRPGERARISTVGRVVRVLGVAVVSCLVLTSIGCEKIEGRYRTRSGNSLFRDSHFVDAVSEYQQALTQIDDPTIHYNLAQAYAKIFKAGYEQPIPLGLKTDPVCQVIPDVKPIEAGLCVKEGDHRSFAECGPKKIQPIEARIAKLKAELGSATTDEQKKDLQGQIFDEQNEINRYTCSSSYTCVESTFCSLTSPQLADLAAVHFQAWINAQPSDDVVKAELVKAVAEVDAAKKAGNEAAAVEAQKRVDDLLDKDQMRKRMTKLWVESDQYDKALDYWQGLLKARPNDVEIMGMIAGLYNRAGNWRASIDWYVKIAALTSEPNSKVATYQFIGNLAWSKLNSRTLVGAESTELADRGIGALQKAAEVQPKSAKLFGLQGAIFNFRSSAHGASWASTIDRASAQDLAKSARVLIEEAKQAQAGQPPAGQPPAGQTPAGQPPAGQPPAGQPPAGQAPGTTPAAPPAPPTPPSPPAAGGSAEKSGG